MVLLSFLFKLRELLGISFVPTAGCWVSPVVVLLLSAHSEIIATALVSSTLVASVRLATLLLSKSWFEVFRSSFDVNPVHALARINFAKLKASNLSEKIKRNDSSRRIKALFELNKVFLVFFNLLLVFNTILFQVDGNRVCCCWCK